MAMFPAFNESGDMPPGIYTGNIEDIKAHFGVTTPRRQQIVERLIRIHRLASSTGHLGRFIIFGSFITSKPDPNDVDIFILMDDSFAVSQLSGEAAFVFNHSVAQSYFGASIFWVRRLAALGGEEATIAHWQIKRSGDKRGIVEVT